jgi:hypothetical protein
MATHTVYELDVRLKDIEPPIWRTVEVPGRATLEDVHYAIQLAMGWTNSHLHHFKIGKLRYGMIGADEFENLEDERDHVLQEVVKAGTSFVYEYDFGDGWEHDVTVTRVAASSKPVRPRCVAGARACPPEDCGGPFGYERLLAALADPDHEAHAELSAWAPLNFDPERFVVSTRDLTREIRELRQRADAGIEEAEIEDAELMESVPRPVIEAALALSPMQRASLVAILAGSLADELMSLVDLLEQATRAANKPRKHTNRTSRQPSIRSRR